MSPTLAEALDAMARQEASAQAALAELWSLASEWIEEVAECDRPTDVEALS